MKLLATLSALVLVIAGCNAGAPATPPTTGCTETASEELYVSAMYACADTSVYVFKSTEARDSWRQAAEGFGIVVTGSGDAWLVVK
jgi:hypothetical protein